MKEFEALAIEHGAVTPEEGLFEVSIAAWTEDGEFYYFMEREQALACRRNLPVMGEFREVGRKPDHFSFFEEV